MSTQRRNEKTIAFVLYPGLTAFDLSGPLQVMSELATLRPEIGSVVVGERIEAMDTDALVQMVPERTFEEVPHPDVLVVPGGTQPTIKAMSDPGIRRYVRTAAETAETVASVCTGALILASVGLLEGRNATTHWASSAILENLGATYHRKRWVEDGRFIMSAGVSAGIDMGLRLAARLTDEATAREVQRALDYDPHPPFGGIDYTEVGLPLRARRAAATLAAPLLTARPKRLTRQERAISGKEER
jgi:transcriptional regulator GlxA family with amidase domain